MNNIYIYNVRVRLLLLMFAAILLTACSDDTDRVTDGKGKLPDGTGKVVDDPDRQAGETDILRISAYIQDMVSPPWSAATRAVTVPSDYSEYTGSSIGVFLTQTQTPPDQNSTKMTLISYEDNAWHSMAKVTSGTHYYIYGYMPAYATCAISENTQYKDGAILTFKGVPSVMSEDFSVITGVLQLEPDPAHEGTAIEDGTLKAGTFAYTGRESGDNYVDLMFDHLYGALNISLRVESNYNDLRTIKLKELKLRTADADGATTTGKTNVTVTLNKTTGDNPIGNIVFTSVPSDEDVSDISFFKSATGQLLETGYSSFMGHFMPQGISTFIVTSVYDVYDKGGNLIRKDCEAKNTLKIGTLFNQQTETHRGWKYNINMTIMPTFLYMLSEPDLDNPTVVVN